MNDRTIKANSPDEPTGTHHSNSSASRSGQSNDFSANNSSDDAMVLCRKIDFMFKTMKIHLTQLFSITDRYVNKLGIVDNSEGAHSKHDFFQLIASREDYGYCVNTIRILLKPDTNNSEVVISPELIASYQHRLVLQVAHDIKSAKRWCRLLEMYSASGSQNNLIIRRWHHAINMITELDFLVDV